MFRHRDLVVLFSNKYNNFLWGSGTSFNFWSRDATQMPTDCDTCDTVTGSAVNFAF
jgi:hypothetical protein